jgi:hypothetical protein
LKWCEYVDLWIKKLGLRLDEPSAKLYVCPSLPCMINVKVCDCVKYQGMRCFKVVQPWTARIMQNGINKTNTFLTK